MPYLAGDKSMKVKLNSVCQSLKRKSCLSAEPCWPGQRPAFLSPDDHPPPIMMVTWSPPAPDIWSRESEMPGERAREERGCAGHFLIWAKHVDWAEERLRGPAQAVMS